MDGSVTDNVGMRNDFLDIVFRSHFPGKPVMPGACLVQMAMEEVVERGAEGGVKMGAEGGVTLKNVKFLRPVTPVVFEDIRCEIEAEEDEYKVVICDDKDIYAKMTIVCTA